MALQLKRAGIPQVRPLAGGFEAWRDLGFPTEPAGDVFVVDRVEPQEIPGLPSPRGRIKES